MRVFVFSLFSLSAAFTPGVLPANRAPLTTQRVAETWASAFFAQDKAPSGEEIEEYCRDPDSSGCTLPMIDAMMSASKAKQPARDAKPLYSKEIDEAIFKCD
uniref:Uncharacterized protein n=1 Tax=Prymnesium polylepis TaxID=72548 RepID=A0A7S4NLA0_9EUKA